MPVNMDKLVFLAYHIESSKPIDYNATCRAFALTGKFSTKQGIVLSKYLQIPTHC